MKTTISAIVIAIVFVCCSKNAADISSALNASDVSDATGKTNLSIYLTDDPGNYDHVYLDIRRIKVHFTDDEGGQWYEFKKFKGRVIDILRFTNGKDTLLATERVSAKHISQFRFILGDSNAVVVDGVTYPLKAPSGQQSGFKVNVDETLTEGVEYEVWTDFDVQKSIVTTGNGKYMLKPVARVYAKVVTGSINGVVLPMDAKSWVYVMSGNKTIASTRPDKETGAFMVSGLAPGSYKVLIESSNGYKSKKYEGVEVSAQNITGTGTTILK